MNPNKQETREDHEDEDDVDVTASIGERRLSLQSLPVGVSRAFNRHTKHRRHNRRNIYTGTM